MLFMSLGAIPVAIASAAQSSLPFRTDVQGERVYQSAIAS